MMEERLLILDLIGFSLCMQCILLWLISSASCFFFILNSCLPHETREHLMIVWYLLTDLNPSLCSTNVLLIDWLTPVFFLQSFFLTFYQKNFKHTNVERIMTPHVSNTQLQKLTIHDQSSSIHLHMPIPVLFWRKPETPDHFTHRYFNM